MAHQKPSRPYIWNMKGFQAQSPKNCTCKLLLAVLHHYYRRRTHWTFISSSALKYMCWLLQFFIQLCISVIKCVSVAFARVHELHLFHSFPWLGWAVFISSHVSGFRRLQVCFSAFGLHSIFWLVKLTPCGEKSLLTFNNRSAVAPLTKTYASTGTGYRNITLFAISCLHILSEKGHLMTLFLQFVNKVTFWKTSMWYF